MEAQDPRKLYELSIKSIDKRNEQLKSFLQDNKTIKITNQEYMEMYNYILQTSDAGANPSTSQQQQKTQNQVNYEEKLFKKLQDLIENYLITDLKVLDEIQEYDLYVEKVRQQYKHFKLYLHWMWQGFQYLDRFYLKNKNTTVKTECFKIFKSKYWDQISNRVFNAIIYFQFKQLRQSQIIPKQTIKILIELYSYIGFNKTFDFSKQEIENFDQRFYDDQGFFIQTNLQETEDYYDKHFQQKFAQELEDFYKNKVQQWITLSTPEYVTEVLKALEKEKEIAKYYYPRSQKKMIQIIEQIAIINNGETVATHPVTGVLHMLENQKDDQLKDIYNLFNHSIDVRKTLEYISTQFQEFLVNQGRNQNKAADQLREEKKPQKEISKEYISNISDLRQKSERLIKEVFNSDLILINARDKSFQQFLNEYERATFYLAQYSDNLLKSDQFNNEQEVDDQLQNILNIFFSLYSRDTFFKHYQRFLSSRLLNSTSKNSQAEQNLIAKFKSEAGQQAVSKIVTMLQDIKQSQEMMQENGSKLQNECSYEMTVNVLTKGCWPLQSTQIGQQDLEPQIRVPQKLKLGINAFETIYKKKYHGRNLDWIYSQGTGVVNFLGQDDRDKTKPSKYTIQCNSYQLLIFLTLQENNNKLTFSKLLEDTQINKEELDFNLQPCFKLKILNRVQKDGPVQESEEVSVNMNFSFKQRKIKCIPGGKAANTKQDKEHQQNQDKLKKEIDQERTYVIEACLVRIMKGKRSAKVNELIPECIQMITNFKAEIPPIKKSIDSLIERDYLRRKQDDFTTVEYVP